MNLRVEYTENGELQFDLVENGKVIPKESYETKHKGELTALSSMMIPDLVKSIFDMCSDTDGMQFATSVVFLTMTDMILRDMKSKTAIVAQKSALKQPGAVKIAIDKNALREALKKEKEEQDRENNG